MFWKKKRETGRLESLTTDLAEAFSKLRIGHYSACLEVAAPFAGTAKVQPTLTADGHFVLGSFQMWLTFNVLDWKREKYLPPSAVQQFADLMYVKVIGPHLGNKYGSGTADKGVLRFGALAREGKDEPHEEFWHRMLEIIFDGTCDITGYRRSSASLGVNTGKTGSLAMLATIQAMTFWLEHVTYQVIALAFGDRQFAEEQAAALKKLM